MVTREQFDFRGDRFNKTVLGLIKTIYDLNFISFSFYLRFLCSLVFITINIATKETKNIEALSILKTVLTQLSMYSQVTQSKAITD